MVCIDLICVKIQTYINCMSIKLREILFIIMGAILNFICDVNCAQQIGT